MSVVLSMRAIGTVQLMLGFYFGLEWHSIWRFFEVLRIGLNWYVSLFPNIRRSNRYLLLTSRGSIVSTLGWFFDETLSIGLTRSKLNIRG